MTQVFLTTTGVGQQWTVPADFGDTNTIDTIGGGGSGGAETGTNGADSGGGGGAWSRVSNLLNLSGNIDYRVGIGGAAVVSTGATILQGIAGGDTWFNGTTLAGSSVGAKAGLGGVASATTANGGLGGAATSGIGVLKNSGGRGGNCNVTSTATGGGGAAGPSGNGNQGVDAGAAGGTNGGSGDAGSGGAAGTGSGSQTPVAGAGGNGTEYDASHGSGGGGGGHRIATATPTVSGGIGGLYGGGGGGANGFGTSTATSGAGRQGLICINYVPGIKWDGTSSNTPSATVLTNASLRAVAFPQLNMTSSLLAIAAQTWSTNTASFLADFKILVDTDTISVNNPTKLSLISSLSVNGLAYDVAAATLPSITAVIVDARIYRSALAVLPGASSFSAVLIFVSNSAFDLSSSLLASTKWWPVALATLPADSGLTANTKQSFAAFANLSGDSSLILNAKSFLIARGSLPLASTLFDDTDIMVRGAAILAASSVWNSTTLQSWNSSATIAASAILNTNAPQFWLSDSLLAATSSLLANAKKYVPATIGADASSSLTTNALRYSTSVAVLTPISTLAADSRQYIPVLSVVAASSVLSANALRYTSAVAVLASSSNLNSVGLARFDSSAVLSSDQSLTANLRLIVTASSVWPITSSFDAKAFYPNMHVSLSGTSTILANAVQRWDVRSSFIPSSDLSLMSLQVWDSRAKIGPVLSYQMFPNQRMFPSSKWSLSSQCVIRAGRMQSMDLDHFVIPSKLRVDTVVHRTAHLGEGHYLLHGSLKRKNKTGVSQFSPAKRLRGGNKVKHTHPGS